MTDIPVDTATDGAQPAARRTGVPRFDVAISIAAIVISAVSLYTGIDNARVQHKLLAASSWPFLGALVSNGDGGKDDIVIGLANSGVGPAKLKSFELFYKGQPLRSGIDLLQRCCGLAADVPTIRRQLPGGFGYSVADETVLRAGESDDVLTFHQGAAAAGSLPAKGAAMRGAADPQVMRRLTAEISHVTFRACYCSVLDECWIGDLWTTRTTPVAACPAPEHPFHPAGR